MHRPSRETLDEDWYFDSMVNSYSKLFFKDFKYLSDSRGRWREPVDDIIDNEVYDRLHILTHPMHYHHNEKTLHDSLIEFINKGNHDRYKFMDNTITDLGDVINENEVI